MSRDKVAPEEVREQVRAMLQQRWRERVAVSYFQKKKVAFNVPGRNQVGWPKKILSTVVGVIVAIPLLVFAALLSLLNDILELFGQGGVLGGTSNEMLFKVKGPRGCLAEQAGDAIKDAGEDIWIAWSHTHAALVGDGRILWQGSGPARPKVELSQARLTWPDGSTAALLQLSGPEYQRLREHGGNP